MTTQNNVLNDNVISYDSGGKVFEHDNDRGKWSSNWDFLTALIANSFSVVNFAVIPALFVNGGGFFFILLYLLGAVLFVIPIFLIQSFLGQFSSTGFISAFRIAPMFKGLGYIIISLNLVAVCYHSIFTAIPLVYLFSSLQPELPWMQCSNHWNSDKCVMDTVKSSNTSTYYLVWSTEEFFHSELAVRYKSEWSVPWKLLTTTFLIWILLAAVMLTKIKIIGQMLRAFTFVMLTVLLILFIRILCLPSSLGLLLDFLTPQFSGPQLVINMSTLLLPVLVFGSGWGTVLTLASYNDFKVNIGKMSIMICISHLIVILFSASITFLIQTYLHINFRKIIFDNGHPLQSIYTKFSFLLGKLEVPQMWSAIFFLMLFLGEFSSCIIQMLSINTALFDEFPKLRNYKYAIIIGLTSGLAIFSVGYNFRNGIYLVMQLMSFSASTQMFICFIELMIVLWVYGRLRFQRDIKFMNGIQFPTWIFFVIRFVTPLFVLATCILYLFHFLFDLFFLPDGNLIWLFLTICIKILPIIILPIYIVVRMSATTGSFLNRFRRLCKPNDWYPVDPVHRQKYEEYLGNSDITHQLVDLNDMEAEYTAEHM